MGERSFKRWASKEKLNVYQWFGVATRETEYVLDHF